MDKKRVYTFGNGQAEGKADMKNLLGGKGANLAEMNLIGIPVPPGFTITTEVCTYYYAHKRKYPAELQGQIEKALAQVERIMGKKFGDVKNPLLMSVRSGARKSMPGMMDTVLNIGLTEKTIPGLIASTGDERFAYDAYRRLVMMFQPHRFSRTRDGFDDFVDVLSQVDQLLLLEVYPAGEKPIVGADSRALARSIRLRGEVEPILIDPVEGNLQAVMKKVLQANDLLLTQGAGNVGAISIELAQNNLYVK